MIIYAGHLADQMAIAIFSVARSPDILRVSCICSSSVPSSGLYRSNWITVPRFH